MIRLALIILGFSTAPAMAQTRADWERCDAATTPQERLTACELFTTNTSIPPVLRAAAHNNRGVAYRFLGQSDLAFTEYTAAIDLYPNDALAIYNRARIFRERGDLERALLEFDRAVALEPEDARFLNEACWIRVIQDRELSDAARICDAAVRAAPTDPEVIDTRALLRIKTGDFSGALADYDAAIALSPDHLDHYRFGRGIALLRLNRQPEGQAEITAALQMNPEIASDYAQWGVTP